MAFNDIGISVCNIVTLCARKMGVLMEGEKRMIKEFWCRMFHKEYHRSYKDRGSLHWFTIIDCKKCKKFWITK